MKTEKIREIVEAILVGGSAGSQPQAQAIPEIAEFAEKYPTLLEMARSASNAAEAEKVRSFLGLMLAQLKNVRKVPKASATDRDAALHGASVEVGKALAEAYLPNLPPPPAPSDADAPSASS